MKSSFVSFVSFLSVRCRGKVRFGIKGSLKGLVWCILLSFHFNFAYNEGRDLGFGEA